MPKIDDKTCQCLQKQALFWPDYTLNHRMIPWNLRGFDQNNNISV